ncbi:aminoglycoside phosphotransferase family protein [Streptomyces thermolineatus]|uniref:aminoglycoside phosphotransferase family protein n=1 Tax=Streptomyces thermolineatus TaxID=44033 RepID=UPI00384DD404
MGIAEVGREARERLAVRFGPKAREWCDRLPALVGELAGRWGLEVLEAGGGGTSRVFRCVRRGDGAVVWMKLTPDPLIAAQEAEALRAWAGIPAVVGLVAQDPEAGALLLEGVDPGTPLRELPGGPWRPERAAGLLGALRGHAPAGGPGSVLPTLAERVEFLFDLAGRRLAGRCGAEEPSLRRLLERGRKEAAALAGSGPAGLVHGDLHPGNVLDGGSGRGFVAVDPRPCLGDPDFDAADWVLEGVSDAAEAVRRAGELAALVPGSSSGRILGWCRALAPLVAVPRAAAGRDDPATRFLLEWCGGSTGG